MVRVKKKSRLIDQLKWNHRSTSVHGLFIFIARTTKSLFILICKIGSFQQQKIKIILQRRIENENRAATNY